MIPQDIQRNVPSKNIGAALRFLIVPPPTSFNHTLAKIRKESTVIGQSPFLAESLFPIFSLYLYHARVPFNYICGALDPT